MANDSIMSVLSEIEIRQIKEAITNIDRTLGRIADKMPGLAKAAGTLRDNLEEAGDTLSDVADASDEFVDVQISGFKKIRVAYRDLLATAEESENKIVQSLGRVAKAATERITEIPSKSYQMAKDSMRRSAPGVAFEAYGIAGLLMYGLQGMAAADVQAAQISQRFEKLGSVGRRELESVKSIMANAKASGIDARSSLEALADAGMTSSESLVNVVSTVDGHMRSLSDYTARLDEIFGLPEGAVAKLSATISTNLGNSLPEAANLVATLGAEARRAGIDVGVMASAIESSVGSMRLGAQSAEGLIKTYSAAAGAARALFGSGARGRAIGADFGRELTQDQSAKDELEKRRGQAMVQAYLNDSSISDDARNRLQAIAQDPLSLVEFSKRPANLVPELADNPKDFSTLRAGIAIDMTNKAGLTSLGGRTRFLTNLLGNEELASKLAGPLGDQLMAGGDSGALPSDLRDALSNAEQDAQNKQDPFERLSEIINSMVSVLLKSVIQLLSGIFALIGSAVYKYTTGGSPSDIGLASPGEIVKAMATQQQLNFEQLKTQASGLGTVGQQMLDVVGIGAYRSGAAGDSARATNAQLLAEAQAKAAQRNAEPMDGVAVSRLTTVDANGVAQTTEVQQSVVYLPVIKTGQNLFFKALPTP